VLTGICLITAGWKLRERIGLSLWQIHAGKVPQYEQNLARSMDRFFTRLRVDSPIMRFNYAIDLSPELFHINSHHNLSPADLPHPLTVDKLFLRVERQFLQRLPRTRAIVFSIRTYVTPVREVTKDVFVAKALKTSVDSYSEEVARYKNKGLWDKVLGEHLNEVIKAEEVHDGR
jgi:dimethylamine monooxygenase subunit A